MGINIEVVGRTWYTVYLTDEDVEKVKQYIKDHKDDLPSFDMNKNFCWAVDELYSQCEIELFSDNNVTESDFEVDEINWSEFEEKTAEEILKK